jgi:anti-sigma regulatory factor (Ser/Thr protein kinase)
MTFFGRAGEDAAQRLEISAVNRLEEIDRVNRTFNAFAGEHGVPDAIRRKLNLVFDELLNNIISYAYQDDSEHIIGIVFSIVDNRFVVTLTDDGRPFNPLDCDDPNIELAVENRPVGGLGVHLVRSVMDEMSYERQGKNNVVTLKKNPLSEGDE